MHAVYFSWMRDFEHLGSTAALASCYEEERWRYEYTKLAKSLAAEFCDLLDGPVPEEHRDGFTAALTKVCQESMFALQGDWSSAEKSVLESHLLEDSHAQDLDLSVGCGSRFLDSDGLQQNLRLHQNLIVVMDRIFLYRIFLFSVSCYRKGKTDHSRHLLDQLARAGDDDLRLAVTVEDAGYRLNHGHFGACLSLLSDVASSKVPSSRRASHVALWEYYRMQSVYAIACQALGRFLEGRAALGKLSQAVSRTRSMGFQDGLLRLSISLAIESEDFVRAGREIDAAKTRLRRNDVNHILWLLESARYSLASGRANVAESDLQSLNEIKRNNGMSRNVVAAVEEMTLLDIHLNRFGELQASIEKYLEEAVNCGDMALSLALSLWSARVQLEHGQLKDAVASCTRALELARARDLGKPKVRCLFMMVSLLTASGRLQEAVRYYDALHDAVCSSHLLIHRLGTEALGGFVIEKQESQLAAVLAQVCNAGMTHFLRPLFHEYGISKQVKCRVIDQNSADFFAENSKFFPREDTETCFVDFAEDVSLSSCTYFFEHEQSLLYAVDSANEGLSGKRSIFFGGTSLLEIVIRRIINGEMLRFTAEDIHRISYPSVTFKSESHGGRVRVFIARLKKYLKDQALPIELHHQAAAGCYVVSFTRPLFRIERVAAAGSEL
jgi:hypothetical protein